MIRFPTHRAPTHPGEMLQTEFLEPLGLTNRELAAAVMLPFCRLLDESAITLGFVSSAATRG